MLTIDIQSAYHCCLLCKQVHTWCGTLSHELAIHSRCHEVNKHALGTCSLMDTSYGWSQRWRTWEHLSINGWGACLLHRCSLSPLEVWMATKARVTIAKVLVVVVEVATVTPLSLSIWSIVITISSWDNSKCWYSSNVSKIEMETQLFLFNSSETLHWLLPLPSSTPSTVAAPASVSHH